MNFRLIKIGFCILLFGAISGFSQEYTPNEIIVKFHENQSMEQVSVQLQSARTELRLNKEQPLEVTALFGTLPPLSSANFFKIKISEPNDLDSLMRQLAALPDVEYAQPNYIHHIDTAPNDPLYPDQWALPLLHMETVWAQTTGLADVLIAIIDTGIEAAHPDLQGTIHINPGEDVNGSGTVEPADFNGIDDDGNGFVDDIRGWDFTDAPHFPDFGDYRERDNDPADEHGHGTAVAGLIGAQLNNEIGIAGMAPGCRLLNLRAGTSRGLLEEDDVAAAVVYAVHMGAQIINMSFGDEVASPLLRDVAAFAADAGVLLVASAGNSGSLSPHYPSGYAEVISVGSITRNLYLSSFSNYGPAIDMVAPGSALLSTSLNSEYQPFSGTSAAAPIVSAAAALLWSKYPDWSAREIHGRLLSTCRDLGQSGPDNLYGNGLVDPLNALDSSGSTILEIITPQSNSGTAEPSISVTGSAAGTYFERYFLRLFMGLEMDSPILELEQAEQVIRGELGRFDLTNLPDTVYTITLTLEKITGQHVEQKVVFEKDTSPPLISNIRLHSMINYGEPAVLLEFSTDDVCEAQLKGIPESNTNQLRLDYLTRDHRILLSQSDWPDKYEFTIITENLSGLPAETAETASINLTHPPVSTTEFTSSDLTIPAGYLLNQPTDFDRDGLPEIVVTEYENNGNYGLLKLFEWQDNRLQEIWSSEVPLIARDVADINGDGILELLAGGGGTVYVLSGTPQTAFPEQIVWKNSKNAWGSRFCDLDQDNLWEIVFRQGELFQLWEQTGKNVFDFALVDSFPNFTTGTNTTGIPHCEIGDFDADGSLEILFGDYDGDLFIYENRGNNSYTPTWSTRMPLVDTIDFLAAGDFNGDGCADFAAGCHSSSELDLEHEYDGRYWHWRIFSQAADDTYSPVWAENFFGFSPLQQFDSGVHAADIDGDGSDELMLFLHPNAYVVDYQNQTNDFFVNWYHNNATSNSGVTVPLPIGDTFFFNTGTECRGFYKTTNTGQMPQPLGLQAVFADTSRLSLRWYPVEGASSYRLYRGRYDAALSFLAETGNENFTDSTLSLGKYSYAVSATNGSEGKLSAPISVNSTLPPEILNTTAESANRLRVEFTEVMDLVTLENPRYFQLNSKNVFSSAIASQNGHGVILTSDSDFSTNRTDTLQLNKLRNRHGMPIQRTDYNALFRWEAPSSAPYLKKATFLVPRRLLLDFNEPLQAESALLPENYFIEPLVPIKTVKISDSGSQIELTISKNDVFGAYGSPYTVRVRNVRNLNGIPIQTGSGDQLSISFFKADLSAVTVFPNPWIGTDTDGIIFGNLTEQARITIYNLSGIPVRTLAETNGDGGCEWDVTDENGRDVPAGIYIYQISADSKSRTGKLAIIR